MKMITTAIITLVAVSAFATGGNKAAKHEEKTAKNTVDCHNKANADKPECKEAAAHK